MNPIITNIIALSIVAQLAAAIIAFLELRAVGRFKYAWMCISVAMLIMVESRVMPFVNSINGEAVNVYSNVASLAVSMLLLYGIRGLKQLFNYLNEKERELQNQANIDFLTGVNNARAFNREAELNLARAKRHGQHLSILMLDIDHFKEVNDVYGHQTGDHALRHLCNVCRSLIREIDVMGRVGGEEFAILLPDTTAAGALVVAERIRATIEDQALITDDHRHVCMTVSIGVCELSAKSDTIKEIKHVADTALYRAKRTGRNRVVAMTADAPLPCVA